MNFNSHATFKYQTVKNSIPLRSFIIIAQQLPCQHKPFSIT